MQQWLPSCITQESFFELSILDGLEDLVAKLDYLIGTDLLRSHLGARLRTGHQTLLINKLWPLDFQEL